jgi:hypothetical protein
MVFRQQGAGAGSFFEVGIVHVEHLMPPHHIPHILRIITYKNGVPDTVKVVQDEVNTKPRLWRLDVTNPVTPGVRKDQQGATFNRMQHPHDRDYRWLVDLEDNTEFYGPLNGKLDTSVLKPVLRIRNGLFYTRLKSHPQTRRKDGVPGKPPFGRAAAAIGCDIELNNGGSATLRFDNTGEDIFDFAIDPSGNTLYEIVNTPPDTHVPGTGEEHFICYYDMFTAAVPKFHFEAQGLLAPGPSPALCGATGLGQFPNPL